jgi:hypothetical protein
LAALDLAPRQNRICAASALQLLRIIVGSDDGGLGCSEKVSCIQAAPWLIIKSSSALDAGSSPRITKRSTAKYNSYFAASPLAHIPTAIDVKFLTGDETALRGKQIKRGVRDVSDIGTERQRLWFDHSPSTFMTSDSAVAARR